MALEQQAPPNNFDHSLSQQLLESGRLRQADLARAQKIQEESGDSLVVLMAKLGLVSEKDIAESLSELCELSLIGVSKFPEVAVADDVLSARFLKQYHLLPLSIDSDILHVAMSNPQDNFAQDAIRLATGKQLRISIALTSEIDDAIERLYGGGRSAMGQIVENLTDAEVDGEDDVEHLRDLASGAPVIRLVNLVMQRAVESRASDIHIEPFENRLKVRYRVDGVLQEVESPPSSSTAAVISRIKIMAKLNIAERRLPQDGRVMLRVQGKELDLRVSTVPTVHGESVVMRILDREALVLDFPKLGFTDLTLDQFSTSLKKPHGIVLVTGPTGSGKTTTLYTALSNLNSPERKIITVEDPVEYELEGINQIHVKSSIGLDFSGALRSIVRQDPDIIMIGEMRDLETARIAIQSALTGHLVLSTIHTNDAAGAVTRLLDMGVDDYLLTSTVIGILAQRLLRQLCQECKQAYPVSAEMAKEMGFTRLQEGAIELYKPGKCEHCGHTGYKGRTTILEMLTMTDPIRQMVMKHATAGEIQRLAVKEGMVLMFDDGLKKALVGMTTIEEVLRVSQDS